MGTGRAKIWRYKHFDDGSPFMEKRATLTACLEKVQQMASDQQSDVFATAALDKIAEFRRLRYPLSVLTNESAARTSVLLLGSGNGSQYGTHSGDHRTVQRPVTETGNRLGYEFVMGVPSVYLLVTLAVSGRRGRAQAPFASHRGLKGLFPKFDFG